MYFGGWKYRIHKHPKTLKWENEGSLWYNILRGDSKLMVLLGKMFRRYVVIFRAWCQKDSDNDAWTNNVWIIFLMERIFLFEFSVLRKYIRAR